MDEDDVLMGVSVDKAEVDAGVCSAVSESAESGAAVEETDDFSVEENDSYDSYDSTDGGGVGGEDEDGDAASDGRVEVGTPSSLCESWSCCRRWR